MSEAAVKENQASLAFFLKIAPYSKDSNEAAQAKFTGLYLRLFGGGIDSVVLTPGQPVYIKSHFVPSKSTGTGGPSEEGPGEVRYLSTTHPDRSWALTLSTAARDTKRSRGWEEVHIQQVPPPFPPAPSTGRPGTTGFEFITSKDSSGNDFEELVYTGEAVQGTGEGQNNVAEWKGWMACRWAYGHPQLFWVTDKLGKEEEGKGLPEFCEQVRIVRVWL